MKEEVIEKKRRRKVREGHEEAKEMYRERNLM